MVDGNPPRRTTFREAVVNRLKEYEWPDGREATTRIWDGAE